MAEKIYLAIYEIDKVEEKDGWVRVYTKIKDEAGTEFEKTTDMPKSLFDLVVTKEPDQNGFYHLDPVLTEILAVFEKYGLFGFQIDFLAEEVKRYYEARTRVAMQNLYNVMDSRFISTSAIDRVYKKESPTPLS